MSLFFVEIEYAQQRREMSQDSGGKYCCYCCHGQQNRVSPVQSVDANYRTIELRKGRYVCVHYYNPYPRDEVFDNKMQDVISRAHPDMHCSGIPRFERKDNTSQGNGSHAKPEETINVTANASGSNVRYVNNDSHSELSSAKHLPGALSPSELTMVSVKDDKGDVSIAKTKSDFMPLPNCALNIKHPNVTLFLLHGVGGSVGIWTEQIKYFVEQGYEVIVPEWIGHGLCPVSADSKDYYFKDIARDLTLIFDLHCKKSNVIIGHSYG